MGFSLSSSYDPGLGDPSLGTASSGLDFGLTNSYNPSLGDPSLGTASSGLDFGLTNSYNPALGLPWLGQAPTTGEPPLWQQILGGLSGLGSILDPYIFTEQERAWVELQKALAEAQKARAQAEMAAIVKEKNSGSNWLLIGGAVLVGGLFVYLLLKD